MAEQQAFAIAGFVAAQRGVKTVSSDRQRPGSGIVLQKEMSSHPESLLRNHATQLLREQGRRIRTRGVFSIGLLPRSR